MAAMVVSMKDSISLKEMSAGPRRKADPAAGLSIMRRVVFNQAAVCQRVETPDPSRERQQEAS